MEKNYYYIIRIIIYVIRRNWKKSTWLRKLIHCKYPTTYKRNMRKPIQGIG